MSNQNNFQVSRHCYRAQLLAAPLPSNSRDAAAASLSTREGAEAAESFSKESQHWCRVLGPMLCSQLRKLREMGKQVKYAF